MSKEMQRKNLKGKNILELKKDDTMIAYLEPFIRIGKFEFGRKIDEILEEHIFNVTPAEGYASKSYTMQSPEITIWVNEENFIETIGCYEECLYKGRNVIGMTIEEFMSHSGEKYYGEPDILDFEEDCNTPQIVYEFEDIGLQIWTKSDVIVTIIASELEENEEMNVKCADPAGPAGNK